MPLGIDAIKVREARHAIEAVLSDSSAQVRLQAARSSGYSSRSVCVGRTSSAAQGSRSGGPSRSGHRVGALGDVKAASALYAALDEPDRFAAWSVRQAIRRLEAWDRAALVEAILDDRRAESALELTDEAWAIPVVEALTEALGRVGAPAVRSRIVANLSGLYRRYPEWSGSWFGTNPIAGQFPEKTRDWSPEGMAAVVRGLALAWPIGTVRSAPRRSPPWARRGRLPSPICVRHWPGIANRPTRRPWSSCSGKLGDNASAPILAVLLNDARYPEEVRAAALRGLATFRDRRSQNARLG